MSIFIFRHVIPTGQFGKCDAFCSVSFQAQKFVTTVKKLNYDPEVCAAL